MAKNFLVRAIIGMVVLCGVGLVAIGIYRNHIASIGFGLLLVFNGIMLSRDE